MGFLKWLHRRIHVVPKPSVEEPSAVESTAPPSGAVDLASNEIFRETVACARHALVMEYRNQRGSTPSDDVLAAWMKPIWLSGRDQVKHIVLKHNAWAISLGERHPDFWRELERATLGRLASGNPFDSSTGG